MPTHTPRKGRRLRNTASFSASVTPRPRGQPRRAVGKVPDARQHDPVGLPDAVRIVGQHDVEPDLVMVRRRLKRALHRPDIARSVVDDGKAGHDARE